ncbi:MAG: hypothetical protein ACK4K0_01030 [Flavobacteriales bacterium]
MKKALSFYNTLLIFSILGVLFVPFSFHLSSIQGKITRLLFEDLILFIAEKLPQIQVANPEISSDSATMYLLFGILFLLALLFSSFLSFFTFWQTHQNKVDPAIRLILIYYLALIMLKYGFDKIFKAQFYLPEPNTLYTPLGMLDKDILYWSTMGTSHVYNVFTGLMEVIPALLLFYYRTRVLGLLILCGVLLNVVCINIGFDISVKLFSSFLLLITGLLLAPWIKNTIRYLMHYPVKPLLPLSGKKLITSKIIRSSLKAGIGILFLLESLLPYIATGNYNDDKAPRNYLHGAYETTFDTLNEQSPTPQLKRLFIHRRNYLIFQYSDDSMEDFKLKINPDNGEFTLTDYHGKTIHLHYSFDEANQELILWSKEYEWKIHSKALTWRKLPAIKPLFHWTVDSIGS